MIKKLVNFFKIFVFLPAFPRISVYVLLVALIIVTFPVIVDSELQRALFFTQDLRYLHSNDSNPGINWRKETNSIRIIPRTKRIDDLDTGAKNERPIGAFKDFFNLLVPAVHMILI